MYLISSKPYFIMYLLSNYKYGPNFLLHSVLKYFWFSDCIWKRIKQKKCYQTLIIYLLLQRWVEIIFHKISFPPVLNSHSITSIVVQLLLFAIKLGALILCLTRTGISFTKCNSLTHAFFERISQLIWNI